MSFPQYVALFFLWCLFLVLELSFSPHFSLGFIQYVPFFILLATPVFVEKRGQYGSVVFAFVAGLTIDGFSEGFFGLFAILFSLAAFILRGILLAYVRRPL